MRIWFECSVFDQITSPKTIITVISFLNRIIQVLYFELLSN